MLNFTVGPVMMDEDICSIGANQVPYFRTPEFSNTMLENERMMKELALAGEEDRVVFLTSSGTGGMEAAIMNMFDSKDKVLVVNGGSFGHRFVELLSIHNIPYTEIVPEAGKAVSAEAIQSFKGQGYTGFVVNIHETSTGVHHDLKLLGDFCQEEGLVFVVDAISSFLADEIDFSGNHIDVMITGSQKALAVPPGISILVLSKRAQEIINQQKAKILYFDLADALKNGERGQTPFTPAVGILLQIHERLTKICAVGLEAQLNSVKSLAEDFRNKISDLPLRIVSDSLSNAVTPLSPTNGMNCKDIFARLKDEYGIWICPNGGATAETIFRVGHIGALTTEDNDVLINALREVML